jgi:hypothetical protein
MGVPGMTLGMEGGNRSFATFGRIQKNISSFVLKNDVHRSVQELLL